jgi:hypothetical protein
MNDATRAQLRKVVTQCRKLLEESVSVELQGKFGIAAHAKKQEVKIEDDARMGHLSDDEKSARRDIIDHFEHIKARDFKPKDALEQLIREIAFTHLNRLCAYKMMEAREVYVGGQKFREAVSRGINSNGFKFYLADHPDDERLFNTGQQDIAYRHFLDWLGGVLSEEIGVLFNPNDPANRLYPPQRILDQVIGLLNGDDIKPDEAELREAWSQIWTDDEAIGWVYQYFTPKELRVEVRKTKQPPKTSYELAFRNQFYTPRYVVEFLTDNTLGRIWHEMLTGQTALTEQCRYMVRHPHEVFLREQQEPPPPPEMQDALAQEQLLTETVYVPHRPKKDPRHLAILDPACGSGHFLLYCFDLLFTIYEEAWHDPDLGAVLQQDYPSVDAFHRALPGLILANNLHGIDIDLRATQIAALSLWFRCQRAYQDAGIQKDRPAITRTHIVCAEPMPGERQLLSEFVNQLEPTLLGQLIDVVFNRMELAGELGALLPIDQEIRDTVATARREYHVELTRRKEEATFLPGMAPLREASAFNLKDLTDDAFLERVEEVIVDALRRYAEDSANGHGFTRKLFAGDAARGFAFVDVCRKRFDVVLMNPPFGQPTESTAAQLASRYDDAAGNLFAMFVLRAKSWLCKGGTVGAITPRTFLALASFERYRKTLLTQSFAVGPLIDLGWEVLDEAQVETCAFVVGLASPDTITSFFDAFAVSQEAKGDDIRNQVTSPRTLRPFSVTTRAFEALPNTTFSYRLPLPVFRALAAGSIASKTMYDAYEGAGITGAAQYIRLWWEVPSESLGTRWYPLAHGGAFAPYFRSIVTVIDWEDDGRRPKQEIIQRYPYLKGNYGLKIKHEDQYFLPGLTYGKRTDALNVSVLPAGCVFSHEGQAIILKDNEYWRECLAFLNAEPTRFCANQICGGHKLAGYVSKLPLPSGIITGLHQFRTGVDDLVEFRQNLAEIDETSRDFIAPTLLRNCEEDGNLRTLCLNALRARLRAEVDLKQMEQGMSYFVGDQLQTNEQLLRSRGAEESEHCEDGEEGRNGTRTDYLLDRCNNDTEQAVRQDSVSPRFANDVVVDAAARSLVADLISYCLGVIVGRWNVKLVMQNGDTITRRDVFAPYNRCSPGMLADGQGVAMRCAPADYPCAVDWDGVLVGRSL